MTVTIEVPEQYIERPHIVEGTPIRRPAVNLKQYEREDGTDTTVSFYAMAYQALGAPEALRFFIEGNHVAVVPEAEGHPHSYTLINHNQPKIAAGWLEYELADGIPEPGKYEMKRDGQLWVIDFENGSFDPGDGP